MAVKDHLHRLVDELPDSEVPVAERYLELLKGSTNDPVLHAFLNATEDDEPVTEEEQAAIEEGHQAIRDGEIVPWETVRAEVLGSD